MKVFPRGRHLRILLLRAATVIVLFVMGECFMMGMPGKTLNGPLPALSAEGQLLAKRLRGHVDMLAGTIGERNTASYSQLRQSAAYIGGRFRELGYIVREEPYLADGKEVANIEAERKGGARPAEIVVIGAHYDSIPGSPAANDNASGVAAVLELARLFKDSKPARTIRFVAFVNEEPPWFTTAQMGSRVYARKARERGEKIVAMLSLETIGYFSDEPGSQHYPAIFNIFYPDRGNFVCFVGNLGSRSLVRRVIGTFRETTPFPSEGVAAPAWIQGIGWSDHWSFWQEGYPALMVTDTAPFRYPHYHEPSDTPDKLDYGRMARVVSGLARVAAELGS